jgi:hypothetical protein
MLPYLCMWIHIVGLYKKLIEAKWKSWPTDHACETRIEGRVAYLIISS